MAVWAGIRTISSTGGLYPLGSIKISYHYANILVGMTNTTKVLVDINLAVQYWNVIHVQCHNIGSTKMDCQSAKFNFH